MERRRERIKNSRQTPLEGGFDCYLRSTWYEAYKNAYNLRHLCLHEFLFFYKEASSDFEDSLDKEYALFLLLDASILNLKDYLLELVDMTLSLLFQLSKLQFILLSYGLSSSVKSSSQDSSSSERKSPIQVSCL